MRSRKFVPVAAGAVAIAALLAGCSGSTEETPVAAESSAQSEQASAPATTPSETPATGLEGVVLPKSEEGCAIADSNGVVVVEPTDTCVEVEQMGLAVFTSLDPTVNPDSRGMTDARIDVVSGTKEAAIPVLAPDEAGGLLVGFIPNVEGQATIDVYLTPADGAEEKVQTLDVTVTPPQGNSIEVLPSEDIDGVADSSSGMSFSFSDPGASDSSSGWIDPDAQ